MDNNVSFTDLSLADPVEKNRSLSRMDKINVIINWAPVENLLRKYYNVGKSGRAPCARKHRLSGVNMIVPGGKMDSS